MTVVDLCRGPDTSNWSGYPNWQAVRGGGMILAGTKATEGTGYRDPTFPYDWPRMASAGLLRIAYGFAHADYGASPEAQADFFCDYVLAHGWNPWDIPALDIEAGGLSGSALSAWINRWCLRVEARLHRPGLIYSGNWYIGDRGASCAGPQARGWKLWCSVYGSSPLVFSGFRDWELWQHSDGSNGAVPHYCPGVGFCDMNIWNGNSDRMWAFAHWHQTQGRRLPKYRLGSRFLDLAFAGTDVAQLQADLNHRLTARRKQNIATDGVYGPKTETAKHYIENMLGFPHVECVKRGCSRHAQLLIHDPSRRPARFRVIAALRGDPTRSH